MLELVPLHIDEPMRMHKGGPNRHIKGYIYLIKESETQKFFYFSYLNKDTAELVLDNLNHANSVDKEAIQANFVSHHTHTLLSENLAEDVRRWNEEIKREENESDNSEDQS